ncbi:TPA: restriction endonuclease subunit S [Campylobacter lari]|nr:restriction endonuclease subunit S [Campylobacter lari]
MGGGYELKMLGEVCEIIAGGDVPKDNFSEIRTENFNIPILSNGVNEKSLYGYTNLPKITKPSITISARGTIGWVNFCDYTFFPIVRLLVLTPKIAVNTKFLYYVMKTKENNYNIETSGIPQLTKPMIEKIQIQIPPLATQEKIVSILDKFHTLTTDLQSGIPAEIKARKKQYEYYRNKLLTFKEAI